MPAQEVDQLAWLIPLSGPELETIKLSDSAGGLVIGRQDDCSVRLMDEKVSRVHARFSFDADQWRITDLESRWGTFLNGHRLAAGQNVPLMEGDLIRITPWTFNFSLAQNTRRGQGSFDDTHAMQTMVRSVVGGESIKVLADDILTLLLESAAGIHAAEDEQTLSQLLLDAAIRGTGLPNAAMLRPVDAQGQIEVIAARMHPTSGGAMYSRSLLAAASTGIVAELSGSSSDNISQSIVQMRINSAICVPLMLGSTPGGATVAAYLYLDSRSHTGAPMTNLRPNASAFCLALGRMAGLALANLKRIDIERRQALMMAELSAGAEAQRWIMPRRDGRFGPFSYVGESRPGQYVGGDFFDVIPLDESRLAVALGDVAGKGIAASVLMTATQGFLHAALREHGEPGRAVTELNRFVAPRKPTGKFVTMWVGVFDAMKNTLSYVDAGHGYGLLVKSDGTVEPLDSGDGLPVGVMDDAQYTAEIATLEPGGRALIISDGIIEQFGLPREIDGQSERQQFELEGVRRSLIEIRDGEDEVATLFNAVIAHAGTDKLSDDATAVLVRW